MPDRVFQIESGFFRTFLAGQATSSIGDTVLRRGIGPRAEIRIVGLSYGLAPGGVQGVLDPSIGFKYRLQDGTAKRAEITLITTTTVPVGASPLRANTWNLTGKIAWTLPVRDLSVGGNLVVSQQGAGAGRFTQDVITAFVAKPLSSRTTLTFEGFVIDHTAPGSSASAYGSVALTYLMNNDTQFDLRLGSGLNQHQNGWFLQGGIAFRF
jgi:hypothetical protein